MKRRRLLFYVFLNIILSALTTLAVLTIWENTPRRVTLPSENGQSVNQVTQAPMATLPPADTIVMEITNVYGAGDIQNEVVQLKRVDSGELSLRGWQLTDSAGHTYTFPDFTLFAGTIQVYTKTGSNTATTLFWGRSDAVWKTGSVVSLLDYQGNLRASFTIP